MFPFIDLFSSTRFRSRDNVSWHPVTEYLPLLSSFRIKLDSLALYCSSVLIPERLGQEVLRHKRQRLRISASQTIRISLRLISPSEYRTLEQTQVQYSDCYAPMNCWNSDGSYCCNP
jgi:hypothetical protein